MPDRRQFLSSAAMGAMAAAAGMPRALFAAGAPGGKRPNVLFIAVDDLNDWIGCLGGHPDVKTPNIDRLAARGVLFTNTQCAAPACNPSRAALMTGIRPSTSGVYHNPQPWRPVMPDAVTLTQHFMANGYTAVGCGKIFHGPYNDDASWDRYQKKTGDPMPPNRPLNGIPNTAHFDWGPVDAADEEMDDYKMVSYAIDFLNRKHDKPFFLACGLFRPHLPWYVPRKYFEMYPLDKIALPNIKEDDLDDVPEIGRRMARPEGDHRKVMETNNWRRAVQGYLASITFTDTMIGRLLDAFDKSAYADNTIICFWADHGWHLGEKLHWRKFALWEEAAHCPMAFVAPGVTKANQRCERPVTLLDIYPTLVDLAGLPARGEVEGSNLRPLLENPDTLWTRPALTTHGRNNHSLRTERWRYIRYSDGSEELYDHDKDPMEWTNLASNTEYTEVKESLAKWLPKVNVEDAPSEGGQKKKAAAKKKAAEKKAKRAKK